MQDEYLENNICKFTPLFKIDYNNKKNILSCCFFKMINSGYKDFTLYTNGLIILNNIISKSKLNYKIRLFIDNSIYNDKSIYDKIIKKLSNVEPVLYSCPNYIINSDYHLGLFGTIVRFFPFFDFPNNDANLVISVDIDSTNKEIFKKKINILKTNVQISKYYKDIYLFKEGPLHRSLLYKFDIFYKDKLNPYVYALSYVSLKRINNEVLINFFKEVNLSKEKTFSYHILFYNYSSKKSYENKFNLGNKFIYGIDEYFLNKTLGEYLIDNNICYSVRITWDIFECLYYHFQIFNSLTKKQIKLIDLIFKYIYKKIHFKFDIKESIKEKFDRIDKIIYDKNNETVYYIKKLLYKLFLYLKKNVNYKFIYSEYYYKLFVDDENFFGIYSIDLIRIINCDKVDKDVIMSEKKFTQKDIDELKLFYEKYSK